LPGEFETAKRVRLLEVHSGSEPVVFIAAGLWRCAFEQGLAHSSVAAVNSEYEAGGEPVHSLSIVLRELPRFGVDAFGDQDVARSFFGAGGPGGKGGCFFSEAVHGGAAAQV